MIDAMSLDFSLMMVLTLIRQQRGAPLHAALRLGHKETAELLQQAGAK
jgi:hypothetical protein